MGECENLPVEIEEDGPEGAGLRAASRIDFKSILLPILIQLALAQIDADPQLLADFQAWREDGEVGARVDSPTFLKGKVGGTKAAMGVYFVKR